jgi:transcriptional regulator
MYIPHFNRVHDRGEAESFVRAVGVATLVTVGPDGAPDATLLPVLWEGERVRAHFARANEHWRRIGDGAAGLLVVSGPDAYVSPSWYASKSEHGRVVPTWNYSTVQLRGRVTVHDDVSWTRELVTRLTERHESGRPDQWHVTDAPESYIDGQLRAIVGVELVVDLVGAKAKWSQNRSAEDRDGVREGFLADGDPAAARRMGSGGL